MISTIRTLCVCLVVAAAAVVNAAAELDCARRSATFDAATHVNALSERACFRISADGLVALVGVDGWQLTRVADGAILSQFDDEIPNARASAFSSDSSKLVYWSGSDKIVVRSVADAVVEQSIEMPHASPRCCVVSRDGRTIAVGTSGALLLVDVSAGLAVPIETGHGGPSLDVALGPAGLVASCSSGHYRPVVLIDSVRRERIRDLERMAPVDLVLLQDRRVSRNDSGRRFSRVAFSPDGKTIVSLGEGLSHHSEIWQWNVATGALIRRDEFPGWHLTEISFADKDGCWLVGSGWVDPDGGEVHGRSMLVLVECASGDVGERLDLPEGHEVFSMYATQAGKSIALFTEEWVHGSKPQLYRREVLIKTK